MTPGSLSVLECMDVREVREDSIKTTNQRLMFDIKALDAHSLTWHMPKQTDNSWLDDKIASARRSSMSTNISI